MSSLATIFFLITSSLIALLHILCLSLGLYTHSPWLAYGVVFFSGAAVALCPFALREQKFRIVPSHLTWLGVLSFVATCSLLWMGFLVTVGDSLQQPGIVGTIVLFTLTLCGGAVGFIIGNNLHTIRL